MKKDKWIWMGHPGHFIGARSCGFVLNTYVGKYIVSTVGEYAPETGRHASEEDLKEVPAAYREWFKIRGFETLGYTRFYETMVFKAGKDDESKCCSYSAMTADGEKDFKGYNNPVSAYKGHLELCKKWSKK